MMNQQLGAHELIELHEVLCSTIDGINQFQLYQPHCKDQQLQNVLQNQLNFMTNEYNSIVNMLNNKSNTGNMGTVRTRSNFSPSYGLRSPSPNQPNTSVNQMDDRDVASGILGWHKASATIRMHAALECADPEIRSTLIQGAKNCADQAYEVWQYMNAKGYYQVPTLKDMTTQTFSNMYQPTTAMNTTSMNATSQFNTMNQNQLNQTQNQSQINQNPNFNTI